MDGAPPCIIKLYKALDNAQSLDKDVKDDNGRNVANENEEYGQNLNGKFAIVVDFVLEEVGLHEPAYKDTGKETTQRQ